MVVIVIGRSTIMSTEEKKQQSSSSSFPVPGKLYRHTGQKERLLYQNIATCTPAGSLLPGDHFLALQSVVNKFIATAGIDGEYCQSILVSVLGRPDAQGWFDHVVGRDNPTWEEYEL